MKTCSEYDDFAEYYDHVGIYRERPDVGFFVDLARDADGEVLEMGCGTGRVLIPCARAGARIMGVDPSLGMLAVCRRKLADETEDVRSRVRLAAGDMRCFSSTSRYALITLPFRSFQHLLTVDDQRRALQALRALLAPGGRLVLDLFNPSIPMLSNERWLDVPLVEPETAMPDGRRLVRSIRIVSRDFFEQIQHLEFVHEITWPDGRVERSADRTALRYLFRFEAEHLLAREGFEIEVVYGDYERHAYGAVPYPGDLIFVARAGS